MDGSSKNENNLVNISIIIAVKNEAENIDALLGSVKNLDYPFELFEVIIVDDNSTDGTLEELRKETAGFHNLFIKELKSTGLSGKREALSFGIRNSHHPNLLITDADCQPQSNWLKAYSRKFALGYDMLFGIAPFFQNKTLINQIGCFENLRSSLLSFSIASLGLTYSAAARNFGFTKKAFESLGGYSKTKDTISGDDDLLLREAVKKKMKIGLVTEPDSFVYSETKNSFNEYLQQRARHTQTSFHYLKKHQLILGFWHLLNLFFLFSPLLMFIDPLFGILLPAKLIVDFAIIKPTQKKFGYKFSIPEIFYLQIFYEILLIVHFFNAQFSEIKWK
jgi:glycosyltransferase involved in cell wall biosynthesis